MWQQQVANEIWTLDNYLSEDLLNEVESYFSLDQSYEMTPGEWIRDCFRRSKVNPTLYSYRVHPSAINENKNLLESLFNPIDTLINRKCPRQNLNELQLFLKSFSADSFYDVHCEPQWRYGEYAFLLFIDDCERGGELVFPSSEDLKSYLSEHKNQEKYLLENQQILKEAGEEMRIVGPYKIRPQRNRAVLFKTGSAHWVNPPQTEEKVLRRTVASWPFATQDLVEDLDTHCKIKDHFTPGG